jgi:hypothetical protein
MALALVLAACASPSEPAPDSRGPSTPPRPAAVALPSAEPVVAAPPASDGGASALAEPLEDPRIGAEEALVLLYPDAGEERSRAADRCASTSDGPERIACLLGARYASDPEAERIAQALYRETGSVAGLEPERIMDGGYRGTLHLVPDLPIGPKRGHLAWVRNALVQSRDFVAALSGRAVPPAAVRYRVTDLRLRFFRSLGKRTPSAYADGFVVGYNTAGSLNISPGAVQETLFHELFHANDAAHGDFSLRALSGIRDGIVKRCGAVTACLSPFAPTDTRVRGGTYYAFQPGNDVREYAAEVGTRYFTETRAALAGQSLSKRPFRCGPPENAEAFRLVAEELFGAVLLGPPCAP